MFAVFQTFLIALIKDKTLIIILLWETKKIKMKQKKINIPDYAFTLRPRHQQGFPKIFRETSGRDFHLRMDDEECLRHLEREEVLKDGPVTSWACEDPSPQKKELFHP